MDIRIDGKPLSQLTLAEITLTVTAIAQHVIGREKPEPKCRHTKGFVQKGDDPFMQCVECGVYKVHFHKNALTRALSMSKEEFRAAYLNKPRRSG